MIRFACVVLATWMPAQALAGTLCAFDPAGKSGDYYKLLGEFAIQAEAWGAGAMEVKAYTDEQTAALDYEAGKCDGVAATGVRLQRFNRFSSTMEAVGGLPSYDHVKALIHDLAKYNPPNLISSDHETAGVLPLGAVYLFVRDRKIDTVNALAGKRIATMDYDKAAPVMVDTVGAVMVPSDLGTMGPKFNNGDVDACYVSAAGWAPFELERGLKVGGGVLDYPIAMATMQLMIRKSKFPEGFGSKSRAWFYDNYDRAMGMVKSSEAEIPSKYWIETQGTEGFDDMFQQVRIKLRDEHKAYDKTMLGAMKKKRCRIDSARSECAESLE